ncbi:hypothetical protein [Modestobacter versicolor]|uniref:DMSO reductase anchor subunit n=1 Tax=Modestobacter versicolor TaxID=429133 RepID=A0A323VC97_9ACTN|nr:hypothetical protein [Modestobacter versicolor]MBB3675790.1 DMSO reductase anchor subunit [Modestobacter versicolor]PZA21820.1 hypothetical protein DMO24_08330 [Modestobacter versicolor]
MTTPAVRQRTTTEQVTWRSVAVLATLLVVPAAAYVATVLRPYELGEPSRLVGFAVLLVGPVGALLALGGAVLQALALFRFDRRTVAPGVVVALGVVGLGALAALLWLASPAGTAVSTWQFD